MYLNEINLVYSQRALAHDRKAISSVHCFEILQEVWDPDIDCVESFVVLHLNSGMRVKNVHRLSKGGISATMADIRVIFGAALKSLSPAIVIAHNHPSGNPNPSHSDETLTKKIVEAGKLLDIKVMDHIIITAQDGYFSFADEGMLK